MGQQVKKVPKPQTANTDFVTVFAALKMILQPYAPQLIVEADSPNGYSLNTHKLGPNKKPMFFAAAKINKNYVSFHLMPVYGAPTLLNGISTELKRHMQGKSCFNFKHMEPELFAELADLTQRGVIAFQSLGWI